MDWATFFKDYAAPITTIAGLLGIVLGYFFGKWDSERKRKWEMEDRDYKRRVEIHDKRIQEVREFLDYASVITSQLSYVEYGIALLLLDIEKNTDLSEYMFDLKILEKNAQKIQQFEPDKSSINVLNDNVLTDLYKKLSETTGSILLHMLDAMEDIKSHTYKFDRDKIWTTLEVCKSAQELVTQMKTRIDELAKRVP